MYVKKKDGSLEPLDVNAIHQACEEAIRSVVPADSVESYLSDLEVSAHLQFYDGISTSEIQTALITAAADKIDVDCPEWSRIAAQLLLRTVYKKSKYKDLATYMRAEKHLFFKDPEKEFNLDLLSEHVMRTHKEVDRDFEYLGLKILHDRYLLRNYDRELLETPSLFYMRVCMGVALAEDSVRTRTQYAMDFYDIISTKQFSPATSTLFNSFLKRPQLSSCFLLSMEDSLEGIFHTLEEAATYSKFSGGIGMDMSLIRSQGSLVKSTGGRSSGVIPYIKLLEGTVRGFNQGGKRPGSAAVYIEPWHADIREFLDVKNNSGDERMRAHDIFPALWIPDLFMKQVEDNGDWYLFNPGDHPELHTLYGDEFEQRYWELVGQEEYTEKLSAVELWKVIVQRIFETGTYWPCFKDTANKRYAQVETGVVKSSNLCTEILLRADDEVSAVCNLGSLNLSRIRDIDLPNIVTLAVRFLDNVLDVGFIPHEKGAKFNQTDRAIGLGVMGYAEYLYQRHVRFDSPDHLQMAHDLFEQISYYAIHASASLAAERGSYPNFRESTWARGVFPHESFETQGPDFPLTMNWARLRGKVIQGMRNSCLLAIAPTSTISDIAGTTPCVELPLENLSVRENLAGTTRIASPLCKYDEDPETFSSVEMEAVIGAASIRQKFIDQSQSLNLRIRNRPRLGHYISELYMMAWKLGVKTTYYLKPLSLDVTQVSPTVKVCSIDNPDCESCQ